MGELNDILHDLESSLGPLSGEPTALEGGITNRNYRVTLGGIDYVLRRPGKDTSLLGIDRDVERVANQAAAGLGLAPAVVACVGDCLITRFIPCRRVTSAELAAAVEEVAPALRAFHDSTISLPARFWVPDLLGAYAKVVLARGGEPGEDYARAVETAARIEAVLPLREPRPCHNDLLAGNIIRAESGARVMIVDWEYAGMGDPRFDLGNLSVNNGFDEDDDERLLHAYHGAPPSAAARAALKLMRVLSDAREGAWGVVQGTISELDFDFGRYAREHFGRLAATVALPDFEEWLAAAGG
ncbi:MAG TPA: phosphotransferase [Solirubrobacteraceae bacterium]|nr:phosphotransferase [Solirubrobacteraceae bacterium]